LSLTHYTEANSLNAESISSYILGNLCDNKLNPAQIVLQGYDGTSVMSGHNSCVQQRIRQIAPQAVYIHCNANCLNLALVDTTNQVQEASEFFAIMQNLYVFLSSAKA